MDRGDTPTDPAGDGTAIRPTDAAGLDAATLDAALAREDRGLLSRAQGCLLAQIAGDSLGALVEFQSAGAIAARYPGGGPCLLEDGGTWGILAGQPTDDSELALSLARTLAAAGTYDRSAVAAGYARWMDSSPFDCGATTATALRPASRALVAGADPAQAAARAASRDSQANGALMRISPLGIFGHALPPAQVAAWAREDALLTHPDPVCQDANALLAVTIAYAIRSGDGAATVYEFAREWARETGLRSEVGDRLEAARVASPPDYTHQMGWVLTALQNAFYQLLASATLEEGLRRTVAAGGDTDTNAAIAGALLGAVHGAAGIPGQWWAAVVTCRPASGAPGVRRPRPREYWPTDAPQLAERLVAAGRRARA